MANIVHRSSILFLREAIPFLTQMSKSIKEKISDRNQLFDAIPIMAQGEIKSHSSSPYPLYQGWADSLSSPSRESVGFPSTESDSGFHECIFHHCFHF
jgi:hypothetical protein